jgi:predicted Zn-dependent protease
VAVLLTLATVSVVSIVCLWGAFQEGATFKAALMGALGLLLAPIAYQLLQTASRLWDLLHVSETDLTVNNLVGRMTSVPWGNIAEIRHHPTLKRLDLSCRGIERTIRIEERIEDFGDLLTLIAERTFHLLGDDEPSPSAEPASSRSLWRHREQLIVGADSMALGDRERPYAGVADIEFKQLGALRAPRLVLLVTMKTGGTLVVPLQGKDPVATYQRLRRAHLDYLDRHQLTPPEAPPVVASRSGGAIWRTVAPVAAPLVALVLLAVLWNLDPLQRFSDARYDRDSSQVWELYRAGRYEEVVQLAGAQLEARNPDERILNSAMILGTSLRRLGRNEGAIRSFEAALPALRSLDNVTAETYGDLFYDLAELYGKRGDIRRALETVEEGLRIRPQSATHQLLAAYWYELLGDQRAARVRYGEILPTLAAGSEGHVVARKRLAALTGQAPAQGPDPLQREQIVHASRRLLLIPINQIDSRVDLDDACLLLESKLELPCGVAALLEIPEERITEGGRLLYHAGHIASLLHQGRRPELEDVFAVGITSHDMYAGNANFVFSSQHPSWRVAVVSSYRLTETLPPYWDADVLATRRLVIQLLSAIGTGFGLDRPTSAHCPLAYPNGLEAFFKKSDRLCQSTQAQWRNVLKPFKDRRMRFDDARLAELARAERRYLMEPDR